MHLQETCDGYEMHFGLNYLSRFNMVSSSLVLTKAIDGCGGFILFRDECGGSK